jgi:hypothetical protein
MGAAYLSGRRVFERSPLRRLPLVTMVTMVIEGDSCVVPLVRGARDARR